MSDLTSIQYRQMIGRAGRYGFDTEADSILCVQNQSEKKKAIELMNRKLERINSCLNIERKGLSRVILESIGTKIVQDSVQMKLFLQNTLLYTQISSLIVEESQGKDQQLNNIDLEHQAWVQMQKQGKQALDFLIFNEIVVQQAQMIERQLHFKFETTKLGLAIIKSNLSPEDGLMVYIDLQNAQQRIVLQNELHLLYLMTPVSNTCIRINWELFHWIYRNLAPIELKICELIGIKEDYIVMFGMPNNNRNQGYVREVQFFNKDQDYCFIKKGLRLNLNWHRQDNIQVYIKFRLTQHILIQRGDFKTLNNLDNCKKNFLEKKNVYQFIQFNCQSIFSLRNLYVNIIKSQIQIISTQKLLFILQ